VVGPGADGPGRLKAEEAAGGLARRFAGETLWIRTVCKVAIN